MTLGKDKPSPGEWFGLIVPLLVLLWVIYAVDRVQKNEHRTGIKRSIEGFKQYVQNVYPGCKVIKVSAVGPGYYDNENRVYRANGVIELVNGTRKPVELLCDQGVCWSRKMEMGK